ncbi:serine palmitoyl transferase subunit [Teratosphaeria nubilosa]|uniref:Serine palmitoyl transferase subunit n=1 Tax=Teratosphaeria nubilosa TaxID=161662 RepID=A0A6G1LJW7_9PEZI|nr:serine palmitoyl transferase subunit [Teratosphaeria nubilosa]
MPIRTIFTAPAPPSSPDAAILSEKEAIRILDPNDLPPPPAAPKARFRPRILNAFSGTPRQTKHPDAHHHPPPPQTDSLKAPQIPSFRPPSPQIPTLSLPTINLTTATGEKSSKMDDAQKPLTLFSPPSPAEAKRIAKMHAAYGPLGSKQHLYTSRFVGEEFPEPIEDEPPYYYLITTYISYLILIIFGHVRDFFGKRFRQEHYKHLREQDGYAPLNSDFDNFYIRRLQLRINDCFRRPVTGVPGRFITLLDRKSDDFNLSFKLTGTTTETLNLSSYNYLGFAQAEGECADEAEKSIRKYGISFCSPRADVGTSELHVEVERLVANFVGKPAATVYSMGFVTNATSFPAFVGKGCLVISDQLNHSSIRFGARVSGAVIDMFKHNDMVDLEHVLRERISQGQPRTHRPWRKILVAVEGLYSMEGTMVNLPGIVALKRKYKFALYVDEAHSIGALGPRGRGVCDYFGIDPSEIDILMGTFTKSFGANGGYICAEKAIIDKIRVTNAGTLYGESPTPAVLTQIATSLKIINGDIAPGQGEERLQRLAFNSRYLRLGLKRLGFIVYGHDDSPIIPLLLYHPAKIPAFSHEMLKRKISVVVVGYPATPLISSRVRLCVSAAHTKDDLDRLLTACDQAGDVLQLKFSSGIAGGQEALHDGLVNEKEGEVRSCLEVGTRLPAVVPPRWKIEDVIARGVEDVKKPLY